MVLFWKLNLAETCNEEESTILKINECLVTKFIDKSAKPNIQVEYHVKS